MRQSRISKLKTNTKPNTHNKKASLVAQTVKNPPAMWEMWVPSLGWEDPMEKGMATYSSIVAWKIPLQRSLVGYCHKASDITE